MAEYIDLDTPLELYVDRGGFYRQQITSLRELLNTNKIPYTAADVVERNRWIPVTERLPKENEDVLVYLWDRQVPYLAWVDTEGRWETNDFYIDIENKPKAWMPLPEPPEKEE